MKLRLYLDEDTAGGNLVQALRATEADFVTVYQAGQSGHSDEQQLTYATQEGRVIYTFNRRDFMALHIDWLMSGQSHRGIIIGQQQRFSVGEQARRLLRIVDELSTEEMKDRVEFLSAWG